MKIVENENETVIYPMLSQNDNENDEDFCIVIGNNINGHIVDDDDLPKIVDALERAMEII